MEKKIKTALISVFHKSGLERIVDLLRENDITIYSTGGTLKFLQESGIVAMPVEDLTTYPSILGGRVKTLHPKVFGGILNRRNSQEDLAQIAEFDIPQIDLVVVDLYPFEETVANASTHPEIIEKIDIGGISLIRAAAKNYEDVVVIPSQNEYSRLEKILSEEATTSQETRKQLAAKAFQISSNYDAQIQNYLNDTPTNLLITESTSKTLRYGENPHQKGYFFGDLSKMLEQISGKELSYNNLLDIDAACKLMKDNPSQLPTFAILKHNNACGYAIRENLVDAWKEALQGDPISAFGGILICNKPVSLEVAEEIDKIFYEVLIAPSFDQEALELLTKKKKRILLKIKNFDFNQSTVRTILNGQLVQDLDQDLVKEENLDTVSNEKPSPNQIKDLLLANVLVKHTKSNGIVLVKNQQLIGSGTGQTSRVDALNQAIHKAKNFNFDLKGAVMASDAFFPFPDCVKIAYESGLSAVIQPGGSIKDKDSIEYCNSVGMPMVFSGFRHFKH
ncbi:MAG: bifunctional phosphoribosylaminoimidazolecarboxamide formyltransferase/IMP cyclohydrolase [Flavobacteriales bacterium]|nr:bifunctional phosphoribosylaminoimidazolecarboxamide formyltransferase/IMP cyclohydrolase [Flavobacteriales bacterium]